MVRIFKNLRNEIRHLNRPGRKELIKYTVTTMMIAVTGSIVVSADILLFETISNLILGLL